MPKVLAQSQPLRRQRLRISHACQACRLKKAKCDGGRPACVRCQRRGKTCTYNGGYKHTDIASAGRLTSSCGHDSEFVPVRRSQRVLRPVAAPRETVSTIGTSTVSDHLDEGLDSDAGRDQNRADYRYTAHGRFAAEVAAAIDTRAGLVSTSNHVPFVDAPLFGELNLSTSPESNGLDFSREPELPPRSYTDQLVGIYWQHVHPAEPIFDREQFFRDYEASYSRQCALLRSDHDVRLSTLYAVFALALQRQETIPLQRRDEEANRYFQRAWALLRPETILWKPGSLALVQCLMVMNRYLHCTTNQYKTWMTAGLAMRIAQSIYCRLPEASSANTPDNDTQIRQGVWASCVAMDRCVSWSLGRTLTSSLIHLHVSHGADSTCLRGRWAVELHEFGNQIQLAQTQTRNRLAASLGLPHLYQQGEYHVVAVQLDDSLNKWESNLPSDCRLQNLRSIADRTARVERYLLHIRLLYYRIVLFRPMLAHFYSMRTPSSQIQAMPSHSDLSGRLLRECAAMCIAAAQKLTSIVMETFDPDDPIGLLPWWYRIYYLHIAGTNFLAAMFVPDLFTESVSNSWQNVLSGLRAHEHLSGYVQQCLRTFETLSSRILETRYPTPVGSGEIPLDGLSMNDVFQDGIFDFDNFLLGTDDFVSLSKL